MSTNNDETDEQIVPPEPRVNPEAFVEIFEGARTAEEELPNPENGLPTKAVTDE